VTEKYKKAEIKLSTAMRQGWVIRPNQCVRFYLSDGCACALGSALLGVGLTENDIYDVMLNIYAIFPQLFERVKHPINEATYSAFAVITDLNDNEEESWTTLEIADWLESIGL
jgi:hypothetical protein